MHSYKDVDVSRIQIASDILKAIAHPIRLSILEHLSEEGSFTVTDIYEDLGFDQSTTSHHLGILKDKGVLVCRKEGKKRYYTIRNKNLKNLIECINTCACIDNE